MGMVTGTAVLRSGDGDTLGRGGDGISGDGDGDKILKAVGMGWEWGQYPWGRLRMGTKVVPVQLSNS